MPILTLALCLLAQGPSPREAAADMAFREVEIAWIAESGTVHSLDQVMGWREASLLRALGCRTYGCRELASDELSRMGPSAIDVLCWGTRLRDPEISSRCRILLDRLYACAACQGSGDFPPFTGSRTCGDCGGSGSMRLRREWDGEAQDYVTVPREVFPRKGGAKR